MRYALLLLFALTSFFSFAQEKKELTVHKIEGKEYYIHVVDTGNTLFAISRRYAIPREEILKANPRLTEILTLGDRLLIPLNKIKRKDLEESPEIDGNFLIHEVQKKNTLYSLAKEYNIEINDIIVQNPEVEDGLKKGMKIKIPVAKIKSEINQSEYVVPAAASPYVTHTVQPKETLYSLSKLYDVTTDSIELVNNGLVGGLKIGQLINIPILKKYKKAIPVKYHFDSSAIKPYYEVALLLPFYLNILEEINGASFNESQSMTHHLHNKAQYAIEFYQGFKLAVDSLTNRGLNLKLKVFDTANDSLTVLKLINGGKLNNADLIVGPFYLSNFMMVADFAKKNNKNIVSPVKLSNKILLGNSFVSKVATSDPIQLKYLGKYMYDSLRFKNIIMVYPDHIEERKRAETVKKEFGRIALKANDTNRLSVIKEVFWDPGNSFGLTSKFSSDEVNVIIVPSKEQAFVTRLLTKLNLQHQYKFKVIGLAAWEHFDNIEISYLQELNVHLIVSEYINDDTFENEHFRRRFAQQYDQIPEKFSYLGFDVAYYYLSLMKDFGLNFQVMLPEYKKEFLSHKFNFMKTGIESGYENHSSYLIRYRNFRKERVY